MTVENIYTRNAYKKTASVIFQLKSVKNHYFGYMQPKRIAELVHMTMLSFHQLVHTLRHIICEKYEKRILEHHVSYITWISKKLTSSIAAYILISPTKCQNLIDILQHAHMFVPKYSK